jgi:hypothetical protein
VSLLEWTGIAIVVAVGLVMVVPMLLKGRIDAGEARFDKDGKMISDKEKRDD